MITSPVTQQESHRISAVPIIAVASDVRTALFKPVEAVRGFLVSYTTATYMILKAF